MIYLSQLILNEHEKMVYGDLANSHKLHQRIMQSFPDEQLDNPRQLWKVLYRHEPDSYKILVQSTVEPDWSRLPSKYLRTSSVKQVNWETKNFSVGEVFQFRLKANPSKRSKETGKTFALYNRSDQLSWLESKANNNGFEIVNSDIIPATNVYGRKDKAANPISIYCVVFQGILRIKNCPQFIQALTDGLGRGRSYGCGLLSIAKVNHN